MASYSMASMTDVIFLLLIFFMVTSTFVSPTALEVDLPKSSEQTAVKKPKSTSTRHSNFTPPSARKVRKPYKTTNCWRFCR